MHVDLQQHTWSSVLIAASRLHVVSALWSEDQEAAISLEPLSIMYGDDRRPSRSVSTIEEIVQSLICCRRLDALGLGGFAVLKYTQG